MKPLASPKGVDRPSPLLAAIFAALLLCGVAACASEEGTTPVCNKDVNENGKIDNAESCNPFATCRINGQDRPAADCCEGLAGFELEACLYGYGEGPDPSGGTGGGGGSGGSGGGN